MQLAYFKLAFVFLVSDLNWGLSFRFGQCKINIKPIYTLNRITSTLYTVENNVKFSRLGKHAYTQIHARKLLRFIKKLTYFIPLTPRHLLLSPHTPTSIVIFHLSSLQVLIERKAFNKRKRTYKKKHDKYV